MTTEVNYDLKFELSGLNNPCSSARLAPKRSSELNVLGKKGQMPSIDSLGAMALARKKRRVGMKD